MDLVVVRDLAFGAALCGAVLVVAAIALLLSRARARRAGALVAVDRPPAPSTLLRSERYRLAGRPDALRQQADGRWIPVELKHRGTPRLGPPLSHRIQVAAYCLLVEEATGKAPPFGLLRYSDGGEFRIIWDRAARADVLGVRAAVDRPYRGEATPSRGRCYACPYRDTCDARFVG